MSLPTNIERLKFKSKEFALCLKDAVRSMLDTIEYSQLNESSYEECFLLNLNDIQKFFNEFSQTQENLFSLVGSNIPTRFPKHKSKLLAMIQHLDYLVNTFKSLVMSSSSWKFKQKLESSSNSQIMM